MEVRLDYYGVTATNGARGLLGDKMREILSSVSEHDREVAVGASFLNFDAREDTKGNRFIGHIRVLRTELPQKGKIGSNDSEDLGLSEDEGISEVTYFIYRYDIDKLVIQYNYHGPKIGHLISVVNKLYKEKVVTGYRPSRCSFIPIILGGEIELAMKSTHITSIIAKSKTPVEDGLVGECARFGDIVKYHDLPKETTIALELRNKEGGLTKAFRSLLARREQIEDYDRLDIKLLNPETGKIEKHDLIKNKLIRNINITSTDKQGHKLDIRSLLSEMDNDMLYCIKEYSWDGNN